MRSPSMNAYSQSVVGQQAVPKKWSNPRWMGEPTMAREKSTRWTAATPGMTFALRSRPPGGFSAWMTFPLRSRNDMPMCHFPNIAVSYPWLRSMPGSVSRSSVIKQGPPTPVNTPR